MPLARIIQRNHSFFSAAPSWTSRWFTFSARQLEKPLPPRKVVPEDEMTESFLKGTGPGGQKINKTSSAVQLKHLPTGLVVKSQATRSREQNRKEARRLLAEKLEELEKGDQSRMAIKAERARSKKASASKKSRRKYRQLEAEKSGEEQHLTEDEQAGVNVRQASSHANDSHDMARKEDISTPG